MPLLFVVCACCLLRRPCLRLPRRLNLLLLLLLLLLQR
jgi:hypothetical protein